MPKIIRIWLIATTLILSTIAATRAALYIAGIESATRDTINASIAKLVPSGEVAEASTDIQKPLPPIDAVEASTPKKSVSR